VRAAWWLLAALSTACGGSLEDPERFAFLVGDGGASVDAASGDAAVGAPDAAADAGAASVPACIIDTFATACATAACHGPGAPQVELVSPGVTARVLDQPSSAGGLCAGRVLVASDGSESLLVGKLSDTPPCGSKMPLVGTITAAQSQCVSDWVDSLAGGP
jgi:hypothetical protein